LRLFDHLDRFFFFDLLHSNEHLEVHHTFLNCNILLDLVDNWDGSATFALLFRLNWRGFSFAEVTDDIGFAFATFGKNLFLDGS
jgi:hypothetical protein